MNDQTNIELVDPKKAHNAEIKRKEVEDRSKMRISSEKAYVLNGKSLKRISYERLVNGKWMKDHSKTIYLGKKNSKSKD